MNLKVRPKIKEDNFTVKDLLIELATSKQLQISPILIVKESEDAFILEESFSSNDRVLFLSNEQFYVSSLHSLVELVLQRLADKGIYNRHIIHIPFKGKIILIGLEQSQLTNIVPFITHLLHIFKKLNNIINGEIERRLWSETVSLAQQLIIASSNYDQLLENIAESFVNYLQFERCAIFAYSSKDEIGIGLFGRQFDNMEVKNIKINIANIPFIKNSLRLFKDQIEERENPQTLYIKNAEVIFPKKYVKLFKLKSAFIVPIYSNSRKDLLGAAIIDRGENSFFSIDYEMMDRLQRLGITAGEMLSSIYKDQVNKTTNSLEFHFSPREIEVLKLIAEGASTNDVASKLHLSEFTIRDYISHILRKMNAKNRTEAVARAIRNGLI